MKDQVPNLQILASRTNRVKNDSDFLEWINSKNEKFKNDFIKQNYIPEDVSYELKDFKKFFEARKEILKEKLTLALEIT
jgi:Ran GTPase-activating protein (RanGAP) involved in mRNA processing and transport